MIINHDKKFVFVCVPKTASTSFRALLGASLSSLPHIYHKNISDILSENPDLENYFKVAFVRNPYSRIISAYQNLVSDSGHHEAHGEILSFKNFDDFIFNFKKTNCRDFKHLQTQTSYTHKDGKLMIDFVGKFEKLNEDFLILKKILNLGDLKLPHLRPTSYFFDKNSVSKKCKDKIYDIYEEDFINFGYDY